MERLACEQGSDPQEVKRIQVTLNLVTVFVFNLFCLHAEERNLFF